jgi:PAS domain S-box-containing protein
MAANQTMRFDHVWGIAARRRQVMVIKAPILDVAGKATHVITIGADVSELNRLRTEADDARHRLQAVLDAVPVSIALKDRQRQYQFVNRTFLESRPGTTQADAIGRRLEEIGPDRAFAEAALQSDLAVLATGADVPPLPLRYPSRTGAMRDFSIHRQAFRAADGVIEGVIVLGIDVTDVLRVTNELRDVNATLERRIADRAAELAKVNTLVSTVIERAPVPIVIHGPGGKIVRWNPAAERLSGYSEAEILSGAVPRRTPEENAEFEQIRQRIASGESIANLEIVRRHKDGRDLTLLFSAAPMRNPNGEPEGAVAILQDITELRATERQLRQAQKMEALGQLTGGVAHDFNNLLAVIMGNLDLLLQDLPPDAPEQELATDAIKAAERGANLVHRLLAFARQQTLRPVATDVDRLITGMRSLLERAVGEAVLIEHIAAGEPWLALVDPNQLENAILNLAVNARDAMPHGGTLTVTTLNAVIDGEEAALHGDLQAGDYVCLTVSDTGCGIPLEIQAQVFEPFFTTKEVGKGSGLGLSMVFGFVKQSGGHVRLDSRPNRGAAISLFLPRVAGSVGEQAPRTGAVSGHGETILLVEDNDQLRRTSVILLTALGYQVIPAEDAASALEQFRQHPEIALLFTDVVLPGGASGFDLARRVRDARPAVPVLFTSGFADPSMARDNGFQGDVVILAKPFRRADLAQKLRACLTPAG